MLSDAQIDRWSRQILLPEVGGRGQERLLAVRVGLLGDGVEAEHAAELLRRAGVRVATGVLPNDADLLIDLARDDAAGAGIARRALAAGVPLVRGRVAGAAAWASTLTVRPCGLCAPAAASRPGEVGGALAGAAAQALGALVAAEAIGALLAAPRHGRRQLIDLAGGTFEGGPLVGPGCAACVERQ